MERLNVAEDGLERFIGKDLVNVAEDGLERVSQ